ncbi:hypothetical protein EG329_003131 [Mollisiaceae sp. DMI_Dod_QoI]|nr:hypothetical protein EG329_003131 [Helotiales sp. DMI_Dod_QoI]
MSHKYFLPAVAPLRSSIPLGSLVPNIRQPSQDALTGPLPMKEGLDFLVHEQNSLGRLLHDAKDSSFKLRLTRLLSASHSNADITSSWLAACKARLYQLTQPKDLFRRLTALEPVREWLQTEIEDGTTAFYFVTGYYTVLDATVDRRTHKSSQLAGNFQVPVGDIVSAGTASLVSGMIDLDVGVSGSHGSSREEREVVQMEGERIYAFCYRKVAFKWFSMRGVEKAILKKDNCWVMASDNRGSGGDEEDEIVQVSLEDVDEEDEDVGGDGVEVFKEEDGVEEYIVLPEE